MRGFDSYTEGLFTMRRLDDFVEGIAAPAASEAAGIPEVDGKIKLLERPFHVQ